MCAITRHFEYCLSFWIDIKIVDFSKRSVEIHIRINHPLQQHLQLHNFIKKYIWENSQFFRFFKADHKTFWPSFCSLQKWQFYWLREIADLIAISKSANLKIIFTQYHCCLCSQLSRLISIRHTMPILPNRLKGTNRKHAVITNLLALIFAPRASIDQKSVAKQTTFKFCSDRFPCQSVFGVTVQSQHWKDHVELWVVSERALCRKINFRGGSTNSRPMTNNWQFVPVDFENRTPSNVLLHSE